MRMKLALSLGLVAAFVTTTALAILYPTRPGQYVSYYNADTELIGQAWWSCGASTPKEWGEITGRPVMSSINCPPPVE
ncbi:DUF6289 family protein [Luteimonas panaciterrae]|uniref:DUF6289 family protein n=1 Tax=Luteimonas panaciterrae TaxID=363885 RepID=UPI001CFB9397|nr:DUF6289 family protein [Luteimonas panaciterrae]